MRLKSECAVLAWFVAAVLVFFFRALVVDTASIPYDLQGLHYPQLFFAGEALRRGEFPLWNPHVYGGMPFAGNIQAALFYPLNLAWLWLGGQVLGTIPYRLIEMELGLHYVIAGLTAYWLGRALGLSRLAGAVAGTAYMLGPFMASQAQHFGFVLGSAWAPLGFLAAWRAIERPGLRWPTLLGLVLGLHILAGLVTATMSLGLGLAALFGLAILGPLGSTGRGQSTGVWIGLRGLWAVVLAAGLAAVQLVPTVELALASVASQRGLGIGSRVEALVTLLVPNFFNMQSPDSYWGAGDFTLDHFYLPPMILALAGLAVSGACRTRARWLLCGSALALVFSTDLVRPILQPLGPVLPPLLRGSFELHTLRLLFDLGMATLAGFGLDAVLGARGRGLRRDGWACWGTLGAVCAALLALAAVAAQWAMAAGGGGANRRDLENAQAALAGVAQALAWLGLTAGALAAVLSARGARAPLRLTGVGLAGLIVVPLFVYGSHQRFNTSPGPSAADLGPTFVGGSDVVAYLQRRQSESGPFRIEDYGRATGLRWATASQLWDLDNANGNDPFLPADTDQYRAAFSRERGSGRPFHEVEVSSPLLRLLNTRFVIGSAADGLRANPRSLDPDGPPNDFQQVFADHYRAFETGSALPRALVVSRAEVMPDRTAMLRALGSGAVDPRMVVLLEAAPSGPHAQPREAHLFPPLSLGEGAVRYQPLGPNRVQIELLGTPGGFLLVLDPFWPGWVATVDGAATEILRADYLFRAVTVSPGDHLVMMSYEPISFRVGLAITLLALPVVLVVLLAPRRLSRTRSGPG
ncbi:MAG TPA: YfhO family protein [Chloroflexota bacterium]|nr:YfhO family protein [Chloroflexota bacterium]